MYATLGGVSCTAPAPCTAVGGYSTTQSSYATNSLIERWNGQAWATQTPFELGPLTSNSCPVLTACQAVGDNVQDAEGWNGTSWTVEPVTAPPGQAYTQAVSCATATACELVSSAAVTIEVSTFFAGVVLVDNAGEPRANGYSSTASAGSTNNASSPGANGAPGPSVRAIHAEGVHPRPA